MLTSQTLPKKLFDLTDEPCPYEEQVTEAVEQSENQTLH